MMMISIICLLVPPGCDKHVPVCYLPAVVAWNLTMTTMMCQFLAALEIKAERTLVPHTPWEQLARGLHPAEQT